MVGLPWQALSFGLALFPAAYGTWTGRRLVRRLDDPAFPELQSAHYQRFAALFAACGVASVVAQPDLAAVNIVLAILGGLAARYAVRRVTHPGRGHGDLRP